MPDFTPDYEFSLSEVVDFMNDHNGVDIGANNISLKSLFAIAQENGIILPNGDYTAPHKMSEFLGMNYSTVPPGSPILRLLDQDGNEITWTQDEIILDVGDEVPPYIFGIGPNDITLNFEPPAPDTILMLVKAGDWEHVTWEGDFISSTSGEGNDDGQFIEPTITTVNGGVEISIASKAGNWQYEMQRIEIEVRRMWMRAGVGAGGLWLQPAEVGDIKKFTEKDIINGELNTSQPTVFNVSVVEATDGAQGVANNSALQELVDETLTACVGEGWEEISWPFTSVGGVQDLAPREAGSFGCNGTISRWPLGVVWDVGAPGTIGTRSILCFKFTKL
jgi:hypothetical protein